MKVFLDRTRLLGDKLGPLLYQTPPQMHRNYDVLEDFLKLLPRDMRHTFEFRHDSWLDEGVFRLLRRYNVALSLLDMPSLATPLVATADFAYMRFHGSTDLYASRYSDDDLQQWAKKLSELSQKLKALYVYFNNDAHAHAVSNAVTMRGILGSQL